MFTIAVPATLDVFYFGKFNSFNEAKDVLLKKGWQEIDKRNDNYFDFVLHYKNPVEGVNFRSICSVIKIDEDKQYDFKDISDLWTYEKD